MSYDSTAHLSQMEDYDDAQSWWNNIDPSSDDEEDATGGRMVVAQSTHWTHKNVMQK